MQILPQGTQLLIQPRTRQVLSAWAGEHGADFKTSPPFWLWISFPSEWELQHHKYKCGHFAARPPSCPRDTATVAFSAESVIHRCTDAASYCAYCSGACSWDQHAWRAVHVHSPSLKGSIPTACDCIICMYNYSPADDCLAVSGVLPRWQCHREQHFTPT